MAPLDTGFPASDARDDFSRARRRHALASLAARLRREPGDVAVVLPFEEVVEALGRVSERSLGLQTIALDSIVGTVGRTREFDRSFRPTSNRTRDRWERIADAQRRGEAMPPIEVYRIGDVHFVRDGHHRVSVARAQGRKEIDAYVTEVTTRVPIDRGTSVRELPLKGHERLFRERVPLADAEFAEVRLSDPWQYGSLAEGVEAWGFRHAHGRRELLSREEVARVWLEEEFRPVVAMLHDADLVGQGTAADAYLRVAAERYRLMRTHEWSDEVIARLRRELD
ncbi:MAG: chromosome partitioning protein ParB [Thermoleophilaceae bacterium]